MRIIKDLGKILYASFVLSSTVLTTGCGRVTYLFTHPISPSAFTDTQRENIQSNEMRFQGEEFEDRGYGEVFRFLSTRF